MDEPFATLLQLIRHVIERGDGAPDFVAWRIARQDACTQSSRPVPAGVIRECGGELLNRPADTMRDHQKRQQRNEPRRTQKHQQRQREPSLQIAGVDRVHDLSGLSKLG